VSIIKTVKELIAAKLKPFTADMWKGDVIIGYDPCTPIERIAKDPIHGRIKNRKLRKLARQSQKRNRK
jgi:hypothetical protein